MDDTNPSPKIGEQTTTVKGRVYKRYVVEFGVVRGKRDRKTFKTRRAAQAHIREREQKDVSNVEARAILEKRIGEKAHKLATDDLLDAVKALDVLKHTTSLETAARFYMDHNDPGGTRHTVEELYEKYKESREKANRRPATIRDIDVCLSPFVEAFGGTRVQHVTIDDLDAWLNEQTGGAVRRNKRRRHLVGMFNFAVKRRYRRDNPASGLEISNEKKRRPHVLSLDDCEQLMRYTADNEPETIPYMALCLFAGVRPEGEIGKLDWKEIDLGRREIFISDEVSKTHDERFIDISDNLLQWLTPYQQKQGPVFYSPSKAKRIRESCGVRWASDCMRHSFGSYHLAMHDNAGKTALQMGHRNLGTLFEHYRRAVRKQDAEAFWAIRPGATKGVMKFPKAR